LCGKSKSKRSFNGGIEKKVEGQEIKAVSPAPRRTGQIVDIFAALKKSLETAGQQKVIADRGKRKRKA
jgi:non-homologous end joining protein Ku